MLGLHDLGLTHFQEREIEEADPELVTAWLHVANAPNIKSPKGMFLYGVRSGDMPLASDDGTRQHAVRLAELWIQNAGLYMPSEAEVLHELFERSGSRLHFWYDDQDLREQILDVYRHEKPRAERAQRETLERAQRNAEAIKAMQAHE